jgi:hypothetical protein
MPLHSYVLASWIDLFGLSAFSFHIFSTLAAFGATAALYRFFPPGPLSWFHALFISLAVYGLLGATGLRMDGMALFLLALGLGICRSHSVGGFFLGNLALALTVITLPSLGLIAFLVSGSVFLYRCRFGEKKEGLLPQFLAMAAAYGLAFLLFLWCIDGRMIEFISGLRQNQQVAAEGVAHRFHFYSAYDLCKWVVAQGAFLLLLAWLVRRDRPHPASLFFLGVLAAGFLLLAYASSTSGLAYHIWAFACLIVALWLIAREKWGVRAMIPWTLIFIVAAFGHGHVALQNCFAQPADPGQRKSLLTQLEQIQPTRIYVDSYALRELYDYRLPGNVRSWEWSLPLRPNSPSDRTVAILSVNTLKGEFSDRAPKPRPLSFFGYSLNGVYTNPYDLAVIEIRP